MADEKSGANSGGKFSYVSDYGWDSSLYPERMRRRGKNDAPILADVAVNKSEKEEKLDTSHGTVDNYGWDTHMYPERRGGAFKAHWFKQMIGLEAREGTLKMSCEKNVYNCFKNSTLFPFLHFYGSCY